MYSIRLIQINDNPHIAYIIRQVSEEYGLAASSGFAVGDSILDQLFEVYQQENATYWVIEDQEGNIVGGGGIAPLQGDADVLEIQKMYFLPQIRRQGLAEKTLNLAFDFAKQHGFKTCYLETTANLWQAVKLYEKLGFQHLSQPLGNTGHSEACKIWMSKNLAAQIN